MNAADLIQMHIKQVKQPGKPIDTDMLIEAIGTTIDRTNRRVAALEKHHMREDG